MITKASLIRRGLFAYFLASQKVGRRRQKLKIRDRGLVISDQDKEKNYIKNYKKQDSGVAL